MSNAKNNFGFVRIATASPKIRVANTVYNADEHLKMMQQAEAEKVSVLIFPELSITGYTCKDLFFQSILLDGALAALEKLRLASISGASAYKGLLFIGLPLKVDGMLFNCAVALSKGKILGVVPKSNLPNYKEFEDVRFFREATAARSTSVNINGVSVPFGIDLLFCATNQPDLVVGAEICEDLWVPIPPSCLQAEAGATLTVNLSASPDTIGKGNYRRQLVSNQSARCLSAYAYAASGVHESTDDVVFGGQCLVAENGEIIAESKRFERNSQLTIADIDLSRLMFERLRTNTFGNFASKYGLTNDFRQIAFNSRVEILSRKLYRKIEAHPFVPKGEQQLSKRCEEIFSIQVAGLAKRLEHAKPGHVTIGISGGLDSTLALLVTCKVFDLLGWSRANIHGYTMPGYGTTSHTKKNAHKLMKQLGITSREVDIRLMCLEQMRATGHKPFGLALLPTLTVSDFVERLGELEKGAQDLEFENVQARMRTNILMNKGFQIGTGDLSELALGWCTFGADHLSSYNPNGSIPKTLVKFLVSWAAQNQFEGEARETLLDICDTAISPELLPLGKDGESQQQTENSIGPYELHDFSLLHFLRYGASPEKILYLASHAKFDREYSEAEKRKWLEVFITRFFGQQYKRSCLPNGPKVGSVSFSPRGDWRMPSDAQVDLWLQWAQ